MNEPIAFRENIFFERVDDSIIVLDSNDGTYFELNAMAATMFERLQQLQDLELTVGSLLSEYDVQENELREDLAALIEQLTSYSLIDSRA